MKRIKLIINILFVFFFIVQNVFCQNSQNDDKSKMYQDAVSQVRAHNDNFIENKGQIKDQYGKLNSSVLYLLQGSEFNVQLRESGFSYDLYQRVFDQDLSEDENGLIQGKKTILKEVKYHRIDFEFVGYNKDFKMITEEVISKFKVNYYSNEGLINAKNFSKVTYKNIYKNIDIEFLTDAENGFKYNFIIHPGGNINAIQMKLDGANSSELKNGNLIFETSVGSLNETIPYSEIVETNEKVNVELVLNNSIISFKTSKEFKGNTLLIDPYPNPTRKWGTFIGGNNDEQLSGKMDVDVNNNLYMVGTTTSTNIATAGAFQSSLSGSKNGCIFKFNLSGAIQWATYFGAGSTEFNSIAVSGSNLYVVGNSYSASYYTTAGVHQTAYAGGLYNGDAVISKIDLNGNVIWSTYYGGSGDEEIISIINPIGDRLFVSGETTSSSGIATPGSYQSTFGGVTSTDVFVAEFNAVTGTRVWGSYYGGSNQDRNRGLDYSTANGGSLIFGVTTKSTENLASAGTYISSKPGTGANDNDGLFCSLSTNGTSRNWATYLGGAGNDILGDEILVAPNGDFYFSIRLSTAQPSFVTPGTFFSTYSSAAMVGSAPSGSTGHIAKFNSLGFPLNVSYFPINLEDIDFNSNYDIICHGQMQDVSNAVMGLTLTPNAIQTSVDITSHYICALSSDLSTLMYGTTIDNPNIQYPKSIVNLPYDNFYISGWTVDLAQVPNNISTPGAYKEVASGGHDYYGILICNTQVQITNAEPLSYTPGLSLSASNNFVTYDWTGQATGSGQSFGITQPGTYYLTSTDYAGCVSKDTIIVDALIIIPTATISGGGTICSGEVSPDVSVALTGTAPWNLTYTINGTPTVVTNILASPYIISNGVAGTYAVTAIVDASLLAGTFSGSAIITINAVVTPTFTQVATICSGAVLSALPTSSTNTVTGTWSPALNNTATTTYTFTPNTGQCASTTTMTITVTDNVTPTFTQVAAICSGEVLTALPTTSTNSINGTWPPALNNTATTEYTFTPNSGQCATTTTMTIIVNTLPVVDLGVDLEINLGDETVLNAITTGNCVWNTGETTTSITVMPSVSTEYCVTVTDANLCVNSNCVQVNVKDICHDLFIPTGFSPNGDGENDSFKIYGNCISEFELFIYNRWGEVVFESVDSTIGWDGMFKGAKLNPAVFAYKLNITFNGEVMVKKGNITLLK